MKLGPRWAEAKCYLYLLCIGMWRGEMHFRGENRAQETTLIAAGTGSVASGNVRLTRIFFNSVECTKAQAEQSFNGWDWQRRM